MKYGDFSSLVQLGVGLHAGTALFQLYGEIGVQPLVRTIARIRSLFSDKEKRPPKETEDELNKLESDFDIFKIRLFNEYKKYVKISTPCVTTAAAVKIDHTRLGRADANLHGGSIITARRGDTATSQRKYWTRRGIAEWLVQRLAEGPPTPVSIDHGFSFPLRYFEIHGLKPDWPAFLDDFQQHWPTDDDSTYVDFVREGACGNGAARAGNSRWRRLTEERASGAKSVFHFDVQGSVVKSTHAGIPWLLFIRQRLGERVHFWPFDGWDIPAGCSAIAEVYPALWSSTMLIALPPGSPARTDDSIELFLKPALTPAARAVAELEGGVT